MGLTTGQTGGSIHLNCDFPSLSYSGPPWPANSGPADVKRRPPEPREPFSSPQRYILEEMGRQFKPRRQGAVFPVKMAVGTPEYGYFPAALAAKIAPHVPAKSAGHTRWQP